MANRASRAGAALICGGCLMVATAAPGQTAPVRYRCAFEQRAGAVDPFRLEFRLDPTSGRAFVAGDAGVEEVVVHAGREAITFVEKVPSGAAQTTTIADRRQAVHSRHTLLPDGFAPSQMTGACETD
jgi:hypothetical protein